jgi:hypothetical protein
MKAWSEQQRPPRPRRVFAPTRLSLFDALSHDLALNFFRLPGFCSMDVLADLDNATSFVRG